MTEGERVGQGERRRKRTFNPASSLLLLFILALAGSAQAPAPPLPSAPVEIDQAPLFNLTGATEQAARERAAEVTGKLSDLVRAESVPAIEARGRRIYAGTRELLAVVSEDAAAEGVSAEELGARWAETMTRRIDLARRQRSGRYWAVALTLIAIAGGIAALLYWLIGRLQRRATGRWGAPRAADESPALRSLLLAWAGNGLRTLVWVLFFVFLVNLLPQTRTQFLSFRERVADRRERAVGWLLSYGIGAIVALVATVFFMRFATALVRTAFDLYERRAAARGAAAARRRSQTLAAIFVRLAQIVIFFVGLMIVLQQLGINVTPILASAGIVGIAVGFGAQSLIKDLFAGFLILLEDQYSVGDVVKIGETNGVVENLTLRVTQVRALDGSLTTIPNGGIATVANLSKGWSRAVLDVEVDYREDVDRAMRVMLEAAREMRRDLPDQILDEPTMLGVDRVTSNSLVLRMLAKTAPAQQADVARELRRRVKLAFDREGVKIPPSQQQVVLAPPEPKK